MTGVSRGHYVVFDDDDASRDSGLRETLRAFEKVRV